MQIPIIGVELMTWMGLLTVIGILMIVGYFYPPVSKWPGINAIPKKWQAIFGFGILLFAAVSTGALSGSFGTADTSDTSTSTLEYYSTTDATVHSYNDLTGATIDGDIDFMNVGASGEEYLKNSGDAKILRTATTSSGTVDMNGWDAEKYPQSTAVIDISGYYNEISEEDMRVEKDNEENTKAFIFRATDMGTIDASKSGTSPSISAGSDSSYTLFYGNSEDDSEIRHAAVKFGSSNNCSLDSVDSGGSLVTVDDTDYVVFDDTTISGGEYATVSLTISVDSGASEASFTWTYDDMFEQYGADDFTSDSDIHSVSSTDQAVTISV